MTGGRRRAYAARVPPEQRREQLLDAALDLVVTRGHDTATVEAVAAHAGVTKPVLYGVFGGRADLLAALLTRETGRALSQLAEILVAGPDPEIGAPEVDGPATAADTAVRMLGAFLDAVRAAPQRWHCIVMPMPGMPAAFHEARDRARTRVLGQVAELVDAAADAGALPSGIDADVVADAVVAVAESAARRTLTDATTHPPERFVAALAAVLRRPGP